MTTTTVTQIFELTNKTYNTQIITKTCGAGMLSLLLKYTKSPYKLID